MTALSETKKPRSAPGESRLRVMLLLDIREGAQERFLEAYEQLRQDVAGVPGHISDQLCQSIENPSQWLITSEWESAPPFLAWVDSPAHVRMVQPMHHCVYDTRSLRFHIMQETFSTPAAERDEDGAADRRSDRRESRRGGPGPVVAADSDGVVRHALTFTVKPGSERTVARILSGYASPEARVDDSTRLLRTSLFMRGNRVVRAIEVTGDLSVALRHVAAQPGVRKAEEALNPHLEEARDLGDPHSARAFFARAALPAVHHLAATDADRAEVRRRAVLYPVRPGCADAVARLLVRQDQLAAARQSSPLVSSTLYQRPDIVVRIVDLRTPFDEDPALVLGVAGRRAPAVLGRLVDLEGHEELTDSAGAARFLAQCEMTPVTDRQAPEA